jgi:6-pyruvoyltetrahydropterin/6-carboxytetrahydropterin synthase
MGQINLEDIIFSDEIMNEWQDTMLFSKIKKGEKFINPLSV